MISPCANELPRAKAFPLACSLALLLVLTAVAARAQILNSERIEQRFGSYGIDVVYSDDDLRISNLYSLHDGVKITRTLAIVGLPASVDLAIDELHEAIVAGGSIGATFKAAGWDVDKTGHVYFDFDAPQALLAGMAIPGDAALAAHAYQLAVQKGRRRFDYAWIIEIHHPDYLGTDDLESIYGPEESVGMLEVTRRLLVRGSESFRRIGLTLSQ